MCKFKSGIVLRSGKLLHSNWTDSHEELVTLFNLKDHREGNFARVEFYPDKLEDYDKPDSYKLHIDEERTPDWFTEQKQEVAIKELRGIIRGMIIDKPVKLMLGGSYILAKGAEVSYANHCRIVVMCGGTLTEMRGGTLTEMRGGTLTAMRGGTLTEMCGGTLTAMRGGTLTAMRGGTLKND